MPILALSSPSKSVVTMPTDHTGASYVNDPASLADICPHLQPPQLKHHAVVVPWPGQGHINPLLRFSQKLVDQGFFVTFVNSDYTHMRVVSSIRRQEEDEEKHAGSDDQANGQQLPPPYISQGVSAYTSAKLGINFVSIPDGVTREDTRNGNITELCQGIIRSAPAFEQLLRYLQPPPTCIISDTFLPHTQDAANKLGIPRISFWTQSAASYAAHLSAARGLIELPLDSEEKCITIPGAPPLRVKDLPSFLQCRDWSDFLFGCAAGPFLRTHEAACVVMNTFHALEGKAMAALQQQEADCTFYVVGPILPLEYFSTMNPLNQSFKHKTGAGLWEEDYGCLKWLDKQEEGSVLYVSFGSIAELSGQEMEELALGLEATGFPVLWVLRLDSLEVGGQRGQLPSGFATRTEGHIMIIEWAPQLHVLAHAAIGGFLTHGGWNSILEAVAQGKPMLGLPYFADQMLNCRCIDEEWGNGLALEQQGSEGVLTRLLVESKARAVMQANGKLRDSALKLRDATRRTILNTHASSSTANFSKFMESLAKLQTSK